MNRKFDGFLIASDLDGTLLSDDKTISERNRAALQRFTEQGGRFCFATGRNLGGCTAYLDMGLCNAPCIFLNGALIISQDRKTQTAQTIDADQMLPLMKEICRCFPDLGCEIFTETGVYVFQDSLVTQMHAKIIQFAFLSYAQLPATAKWLKVNFTGEPERIQQMRRRFQAELAPYAAVSSIPAFLEVTEKKANKGDAVLTVAEQIGICPEKICVIGDSGNDMAMMQKVQNSFAPANADEDIRQAARYLVTDNESGAIADMIERIEAELL